MENQVTLPEGWLMKSLGELVEAKYGKGLRQDRRIGGHVPVYGSNGQVGRHGVALSKAPAIIVGRKGSAGAVHFSNEPCWPIDTTYFIDRFPENLEPRYLYRSLSFQNLPDLDRSTAVPGLNRDDLYAIQFPLPPLPEQRRIVEKIERLLEQSRTARGALGRIPPLLKRFRQSVLAKAFRGELTERDPNDEPASVLLESIREERRRMWEEDLRAKGKDPRKAEYSEPEPPDASGLPELPEGWVWTTIGDVTVNFDGMRVPVKETKRKQMQGPYPYYGASGIIDHVDDFIFDGHYLLVGEDGANLLNRASPIGFRALGRFWVNNHAHVLQAHCEVPLSYLEHFFGSIDLTPYVTGTAQPKMTQANMNSIPHPLAPLPEQRRLVRKLEALFAQADAIDQAVTSARRRAENVDQAVLARAFRGEL